MVQLTNRLEKINAVAMPLAVRSTLRDIAFDMKKNELPKSFNDRFTVRKPTFLKNVSTVIFPKKTYKISEMESTVGLNKKANTLHEQEDGATVSGRLYTPLVGARVGNTNAGLISKSAYLKTILPNIKGGSNLIGKRKGTGFKGKEGQPLVRAAFKAGKGGVLIYNDVLFQVRHTQNKPSLMIVLNPVYSYKENRIFKLKPKKFMEAAANKSYPKADDFYTKNANYQFNRLKK